MGFRLGNPSRKPTRLRIGRLRQKQAGGYKPPALSEQTHLEHPKSVRSHRRRRDDAEVHAQLMENALATGLPQSHDLAIGGHLGNPQGIVQRHASGLEDLGVEGVLYGLGHD